MKYIIVIFILIIFILILILILIMKSTTRLAPLNVLTRERGTEICCDMSRKSLKIERFECDESSNSHLLPSNRHLIFFSHAPKTPYYPEKIWTSMIQDPYFQPSYQHAFYQDGYFYPLF